MVAKPKPYCTPAMLKALQALGNGSTLDDLSISRDTYLAVCSRGWAKAVTGRITDKGRAYLKERTQ